MPSFDILKSTNAVPTFRVESIRGMFDLQSAHVQERFNGAIDIEDRQWNIGAIVGASGSGKTTIARDVFGEAMRATYQSASIIDDMPKAFDVKEIAKTFVSVGFGSVPSWLKPYSVLSTGEQMRTDLAMAIMSDSDPIVFDEFTSVVNREVAKTGSYAIQKAVRRSGRHFVAVTCHRDVIDWLEPDWIYDTDEKRFFFVEANTNGHRSNSLSAKSTNNIDAMCGRVLQSIII